MLRLKKMVRLPVRYIKAHLDILQLAENCYKKAHFPGVHQGPEKYSLSQCAENQAFFFRSA